MDWLQIIIQAGAVGISIALIWLFYKFSGKITDLIKTILAELAESRRNYTSFVQENNHTTTELVKEATATMVQVKDSIETHNEILKIMIDKLK